MESGCKEKCIHLKHIYVNVDWREGEVAHMSTYESLIHNIIESIFFPFEGVCFEEGCDWEGTYHILIITWLVVEHVDR